MRKPEAYVVSLRFSPGLAKEFTILGNNLHKNGWNVTYLLSSEYSSMRNGEQTNDKFLTKSLSYGDVILETLTSPFTILPKARDLLQKKKPDLLLIYNSHPVNTVIAWLAKQIFPVGIRAIYLHEPYVPDRSSYGAKGSLMISFSEWFQAITLHHCNQAIIPSAHSIELFKRRHSNYPGQVHLAPILLPEKSLSTQLERRFISLIGNLNKSRGLEDFITLINHVAEDGEAIHFKIVTRSDLSGQLQQLSKIAKALLTIVNKPMISDDEIAKTVAESIAIFLPHKQAAQSGNIPVAFREGTPVIARNIPGLAQHVNHKKNGYLFPYDAKPEQLLEAVHYVRENMLRLSHQARQDFEDTFAESNWERYYKWLILLCFEFRKSQIR